MPRSLSTTLAGAVTALALLTSACSTGADAIEKVDPAAAVRIIGGGKHIVIDVRTPAEYAAGHVEGAENVDVMARSFERDVKQLDKGGEYVLYCQSGKRSASAAKKMAALGYRHIVDAGGIMSLESAGASIVTD
jgi:rhodanese-related sulfurtransferase